MDIRKLTESDAEALWRLRLYALETDAISFGESPEELRKTTAEEYASRLRSGDTGNFVLGGLEGEAMVAMTGFYREAAVKRRHKGWIWGVFVSPIGARKGRRAGASRQGGPDSERFARAPLYSPDGFHDATGGYQALS
jgi:hypothetical protein